MENNLYRFAVGGVCIHDNKVVLLRRRDDAEIYPSIWELPSGAVDANENLIDALRREVFEETALHVKVGICVGYFMYRSRGNTPCIQINHFCKLKGSDPSDLRFSEEHSKAKWVDLNQALAINISQSVREILEFTIEAIQHGINL